LVRAKGLLWLASRPNDAINFSQAGGSSRLEKAAENKDFIEGKWSKQWGDRMNELVFIGQDMDKEKITVDLEDCLLQLEEEILYTSDHKFEDSFPTEI